MIKYLVFWITSVFVSAPCPDIYPDPYFPGQMTGRTGCMVMHGEYKRDTSVAFFSDLQSAQDFHDGGLADTRIERIWVDSTEIPAPVVHTISFPKNVGAFYIE
jgi:hypothetical protein